MGSKMNAYEKVSLWILILKSIWFLVKLTCLILSGFWLMVLLMVMLDLTLHVFELMFYSVIISGIIYLAIWSIVKDTKKALRYHVIVGFIVGCSVSALISIFLQK